MTYLDCYNNLLTELDVSMNTALMVLWCRDNQLTALDIRNCPNLDLSNSNYFNADPNVLIISPNSDGLPSFGNHSLILSGQLGLDFYATIPETTKTDGAYTAFTVNDKTGNPAMFSNVASTDILSDDTYRFTCYINSVQMADNITAMFCYSDGTRNLNLAAAQDYTVKEYLDTIITSADLQAASPNLVALAEAIKDFGHYVQIPLALYNGWKIGVNHAEIDCAHTSADIDADSANVTEKLAKYALSRDKAEALTAGITGLQYDLELDSETTINVYLSPASEAGNVQAYITDDEGDYDGKTDMAVYDPSTGRYTVSIAGISAHKLGKFYTVRVTTSKGEFPVKVSALSYADTVMKSDSYDNDLKRAVIALYKYYAATMKYRGTPVDEGE